MKEKKVLAWIGTSCPFCGWTGTSTVTEVDSNERPVVRCPECKERIKVE